jgi:hypothetical protein
LVLEDQYGTYALRLAALDNQLQDRMARWAADHLAKLTDNVKRDGNNLCQQVHSDCTSTIADLTAANRSSINALQVNFLCKMTDQITKALINEKREFHALVMNTLTKSNHHCKRLSSCLREVAAELRRWKACESATQFLEDKFHTSPATGTPTSTANTHTVPPTSLLQQLLVAQSPLDNCPKPIFTP